MISPLFNDFFFNAPIVFFRDEFGNLVSNKKSNFYEDISKTDNLVVILIITDGSDPVSQSVLKFSPPGWSIDQVVFPITYFQPYNA